MENKFKDGDFGRKILLTLAGVLMAYLIFYLGTLMRNNVKKYQYIGSADQMERTVTVNGAGKASGRNDIAATTIGYSNTGQDIAKAQADNKKIMDPVLADLKKMGIADKDLQSNYSIAPEFVFTPQTGNELKGYRISNSVEVKIRDLTKIPAVLALAGKYGANEVGGLSFNVDDPENLKTQARDKAVEDAKLKAVELAARLGVRLAGVVSYNEYESGPAPYPYAFAAKDAATGGEAPPPAIATGSRDITINVSLTYRITQ